MLELIGALAVSGVLGYFAAIASMKLSEHFGWWKGLELAALVPMLALGVIVFLSVSAIMFSFQRSSGMDDEAYALCKALNGACSCYNDPRPPCDSMLDMVEDEVREADERDRMERERIAAEDERNDF